MDSKHTFRSWSTRVRRRSVCLLKISEEPPNPWRQRTLRGQAGATGKLTTAGLSSTTAAGASGQAISFLRVASSTAGDAVSPFPELTGGSGGTAAAAGVGAGPDSASAVKAGTRVSLNHACFRSSSRRKRWGPAAAGNSLKPRGAQRSHPAMRSALTRPSPEAAQATTGQGSAWALP